MGHIIESDYGFLKSNDEKLNYLVKHFYNFKSISTYEKYYFKPNKTKKIKNPINKSDNSSNISMPTFSVDDYLPSLPLPSLAKTLDKYLESVKPFLSQEEFNNTQKVVNEFAKRDGKTLHELLEQRAKNHRNWLEDWWLDWAYLEWRGPIAPFINTSGYLGGSSEKEFQFVPKDFKLDVRLAYLALQCYHYVHFHDDLRHERFPIHQSRSNYFSMSQWYNLFNTCRIPCVGKDRLDVHFRTTSESSECPSYIIVIYKYRFYRLETRMDGKILNISEFYRQLEKIVSKKENQTFGVGIGALTADYRDNWAKNRQHLINLHNFNQKSLEVIEKSMYVIVLDESEALCNSDLAAIGLGGDPKNRFFDKSFQSICTKNARFTSNVDHTPFDGMVSGSLVNCCINGKKRDKYDISMTDTFEVRPNLPEPYEIQFVHDEKIKNEIQRSAEAFIQNAASLLCSELKLTSSNKEMIKSFKINPDTFVQMCMQLAYYQLHKKPGPTYETATTRSYYHGRTETLRSCTSEAAEWSKQMTNTDKTTRLADKELLELFRTACKKHDKLMQECRQNSGLDRHLLGLKLVARDLDMKCPDIFTDSAWKKSGGDGNFVISSSCLGFTNSTGTCAAMCTDGYSMIYCFPDDGITFALGAYKESKETSLSEISKSLESAFEQTKTLFKTQSKI